MSCFRFHSQLSNLLEKFAAGWENRKLEENENLFHDEKKTHREKEKRYDDDNSTKVDNNFHYSSYTDEEFLIQFCKRWRKKAAELCVRQWKTVENSAEKHKKRWLN